METTNQQELGALAGDVRQFVAQDSDKGAERSLDTLCPVGRTVELKVGAQVCYLINRNVGRGQQASSLSSKHKLWNFHRYRLVLYQHVYDLVCVIRISLIRTLMRALFNDIHGYFYKVLH